MSHEARELTVVGIGELLWDLLPGGKQLGGAPANFAYHAKALCGSGIPVSCVGTDALGSEAVALLAQHGLSTGYVAINEDRPTGTVSVSLDDAGVPNYTIHEEVAWDFVTETAPLIDLARAADAVCFGSLAQRSPVTRATIHAFLRASRPDCLKVFDINLRQSYYDVEIIRASLDLAHVLKLNDEELPVLQTMLGLAEEESEALTQLREEFSIQVIALTRGAQGAVMVSAEEQVYQAGIPPVHIADTVGAGDAFTASMTVGLLRRHDLARICSDANQRASYVCSQQGAMPPIREMLIAQ
jgi:fructokinase